jgi:hypothetical protein
MLVPRSELRPGLHRRLDGLLPAAERPRFHRSTARLDVPVYFLERRKDRWHFSPIPRSSGSQSLCMSAVLVSYIGAFAKMAQLKQWVWFFLLFVPTVTMLVYIFVGPETDKEPGPHVYAHSG